MPISGVSVAESGGSNKGAMRIYAVTILLAVDMILSGCTRGRSGTHVEPNHEEISRIEKVGLCVKVEKGFGVRLQYVSNADQVFFGNLILGISSGTQGSLKATGGVVGDLTALGAGIGAAAAVAGEFSPDKRATRALTPEAAKMKSAEAIGYVLLDKLDAAKIFPEIEILPYGKPAAAGAQRKDALFVFTVRRWGLRPPLGSKYDVHNTGDNAPAQLELDINIKLISSATGKVLWERDEFYVDGKSYTLSDFKSQKGLLVGRLKYALHLVCDWMAVELSVTR